MAKKNLPNDDLKQFLGIQGCKDIGNVSFQCCRRGRQYTYIYQHSDSIKGFQESIAVVVDLELDQHLSNAEFYSLLIDESTDIATDHNQITYMCYVTYVLNGEVFTRFLSLVEFPGTANEIVDTVSTICTARTLSLQKLWRVASDGASVMVGCHNGVTSQLKTKNPFLKSIHCIAHRLALASEQAADNIPYLQQYQLYINNVYKYFHCSMKHVAKLKEIQAVLDMADRKFHGVVHTHWLLFEGAVDAIAASLEPLYAEECSSDPTAGGILKFMESFKFVATTFLLADVFPVLAQLDKRFQRSQVDFFTTVNLKDSRVTSTLESFKLTAGLKLKSSLCQVSTTHHISIIWATVYLIVKNRGTISILINVLNKLIDVKCPDSHIISVFLIFGPHNLPSPADLPIYGCTKIDVLADLFCVSTENFTESQSDVECKSLLDGDELRDG